MKKYEIKIQILDKTYIDQLIVALVRQGHSVYYNAVDCDKPVVCFSASDEEVTLVEH